MRDPLRLCHLPHARGAGGQGGVAGINGTRTAEHMDICWCMLRSVRLHQPARNAMPLTQVVAAHSLMHHDATAWRCRPAPGPGEVVWQNVG